MVLKNKNLQKLEKVANRTPHFGIRKLTIGAASVLLGTTLWLGKDAVLAQAADQTNANEGSNDAKAVTESDKSADNSVDANTKVIVNSNQAADSSAAVTSDKSSSAVVSQSGADKSQNITGNVSDSAKTNIENNQTSSAAKQSSAQSSVVQSNNANSSATSQKQVSPAARADNAIKEQAQSIQSKLSENRNEIAANAQNKLGLNADLTPVQQAQKSIQQAGNQGKVDLDNIDLTKGINAAANKTDANLGAKNVLGNKLALKANASNSSAVLQNNTNDSNNVDSNKSGASLVGGANVSANDGQDVNSNKINKVVVDQNQKDQATSIINKGNAALIAAAKESATELFDKKASSFAAPAALLASLAEEPNASGETDADNYQTATDWSGVVNALNSNANGVKVSGNITADSDLDIAAGKNFTIVGVDKNATLDLGSNIISNDGNLTLKDITINGAVNGSGNVEIKGKVSSNVDARVITGTADQQGFANATNTASGGFLSDTFNNKKPSTLSNTNSAIIRNIKNRKLPNFYASNLTIDDNASLTINRTETGDGIVLKDGAITNGSHITELNPDAGKLNVGNNGILNINLKDSQLTGDQLKSSEFNNGGIYDARGIDNLNAAVRVNTSGSFITGKNAIVNLRVGHGRGIVFSENNVTTSADQNNIGVYNSNYTFKGQEGGVYGGWTLSDKGSTAFTDYIKANPGIKNTFKLGNGTHLTFMGREAFMLGNNSSFDTGENSTVIVHTYGHGNAIDMGSADSDHKINDQTDLSGQMIIGAGTDAEFYSDGKNTTLAGANYGSNNYISLGGGGKIAVLKNATLKVIMTNRGFSERNDNISINSRDPNLNPEIYVGNNAVFDAESDSTNGNAEIIAIPLAASKSESIVLDNVKYFNVQRTAKATATILAPGDPDLSRALSKAGYADTHDGYGNLIIMNTGRDGKGHLIAYGDLAAFKWDSGDKTNNYKPDLNNVNSVTYDPKLTVSQNFSNLEKSANQTWTNMYGFDIPYTAFSEAKNGQVWVDPSGSTAGTNVNSENGHPFTDLVKGFDPYMSQRIVVIGHSLQPVNEQRTIHYVVQDVDSKGNPIETDPTQMREIANPFVQSAQGDNARSQELYKDNATDQLVEVERNADGTPKVDANGAVIPVRDSNGNYVSDGTNVNWNAKDGSIVKGADGHYYFVSYKAPQTITGTDGNGKTVQSLDGGAYQLATDAQLVTITTNADEVVKDGTVVNSKNFANTQSEFKSGNYYNTYKDGNLYIVYRATSKKPSTNENIRDVNLTENVSRNVYYKLSDDKLTAGQQQLVDALRSGFDMSKATTSQLHFLHALNSQDGLTEDNLTSDELNVLSHLTEVPHNELQPQNSQTLVTKQTVTFTGTGKVDITTGKLNGNITWTPTNATYGELDAPSLTDHSSMPTRINTEDVLNSKAVDITIPGKTAPTVKEVLDYEANQAAAKAKLPTDKDGNIIYDQMSDPSNYPNMSAVSKDEYIFDQLRLTTNEGRNYNLSPVEVTLTVDRLKQGQKTLNPDIHVYFTNANTGELLEPEQTVSESDLSNPEYVSFNGGRYLIQVSNLRSQSGSAVAVKVNNNFGLTEVYEYGQNTPNQESSHIWGLFKPEVITQTVSYKDQETSQEIPGYSPITAQGLTGQHFQVTNDEMPEIIGYELQKGNQPENEPSGQISNYTVGSTHVRIYPTDMSNGEHFITEVHTIGENGSDHVTFYLDNNELQPDKGVSDIPYNGDPITFYNGNFIVHNPYVPQTENVTLLYKKTPGSYQSADRYFVYTPAKQQGTVIVNFYDDTDNKSIADVGYNSGKQNEGTAITYNPSIDQQNLINEGYVYVKTDGTLPTTVPVGTTTVTIHMKHGLEDVNKNNPHDLDVDRKVSRQIKYTIDRQPTTRLTNQNQSAEFERTGHWDKVDHKLVDVQNGQIVTENGKTVDGHLSDWKVINGDSDFTGFAQPTLDGYHVDSVTSDPTSALDANAVASGDNEGQVKQVTATQDYGNVTVTIDLTKDAPEKANLKIVDDTTGKTLNDGISAEGDENKPISFASGESTVDGYLNNHYRFVSVVNDANPNNPLSTTSYADGAAKFGNYDTDPKTDQNFTVHLVHQIDRIDKNNPHGQKVTATVTRQVNYTVDGVPDSSLPSHTETANFSATGYYDEVTNKVVDLVDGTTIEQGKAKVDQNGNETDGHLTWTVDGGTTDSSTLTGYAVPTKAGYHVNNVTVDPAADKDANAEDTGLVKDLSVNHESQNVTITINLTKNAPEAAHLRIIDDTTGKTLNDNINASGDENTAISFTNGQSTVDGYLQNGYKFVSVVNDATPNSPLSTTSYADGAAKFGNYDTDPNSNQRFTVHLKHDFETVDKNNPHDLDVDRTITRQINYTIDGQPTSQLTGHSQSAEFERTGYWDKVDHKLVDVVDGNVVAQNGQTVDGHLSDWKLTNGTSNFVGFDKPTLADYHVDRITADPTSALNDNVIATGVNEGQVKQVTVNQDSKNVTITIDLTKNPVADVQDVVNYIDDTTNKTLRTDTGSALKSLTGKPNDNVTYTTADIIKGYTDQGYRLVSNDFNDGHETFGKAGKTYNVHLAHKVETFTGDNPYGVTAKATVNRQVNYTVNGVPDSSLPSHTETANFSATGHYDLVEHKVVDMVNGQEKVTNGQVDDGHLTWKVDGGTEDSSTLTGYAVPTKAGYHVNNVTVDPAADKDTNADDTGLVKDLSVNHGSHNVTVTINLTKNGQTVKNQRTINTKATVHYVIDGNDADKPAAPVDDVQDDFQFNYSGDIYDAVTGKLISRGQWTTGTSHAYHEVNSPAIKGCHTDTAVVPSSKLTVTTDKPTVEVTVHYIKNGQETRNKQDLDTSATVHYVIDGNDADKPAAPADNVQKGFTFSYSGDVYDKFTGQLIHEGSWNAESHAYDAVTSPVINGYHTEVTVVPASELTVDRFNRHIEVTVHYVKNGQTVRNEHDINTSATVHYVIDGDDANKPVAPADNVQKNFQFHYSGDIYDAQTGKLISNGHWNANTHAYDAVTSPVINGYHAVITVVPSSQLTVTQDKPDVTVTVHYVKNGTTVKNQQSVTASQKVEYQDDQGNTLSPEKDQNFTFNYSGDTYDAVTGDLISRGHWSVASHNFTGENVPVINGYVAVSGYTKNGDSYTAGGFDTIPTATDAERNRTFIVVYKKTSNIVPVDPNHNPIPDVPNPQYPNDPKNPTNVTPNEPVPKIPGYTPETPTVTPTDPTKPTEVVYTRDQVAQVVYRDVNDPQHTIILDKDGNLTGKAGDAVKDDQVPTKISNFEEKGYVLVSNGFTDPVFDDVAGNIQSFYVDFKHQTTTVTPDKPGHPGQPVNPDNPNGPKYPTGTDLNQVKRTGTQTIHYQGAGDKTPGDNKQSFDFTRTITFDDVTGKIITTTPWNVSSHTFGNVDTPVIDGYHADKGTAGGTTITPDDLNKTVVVTYSPNGKIVPVGPDHKPIPNAPQPQYPTNPKDPTNVTPNEPVPTVPGYTPTQPTVTPTDPGKDTPVVYVQDQVAQVIYQDVNDPNNVITLGTDTGLTGKAGDAIKDDQVPTKIQNFENQGYVLVNNGFTGAVFDNVAGNTQTFYVTFKHGTVTINPKNPGKPGQPINPNDPNGPKWSDDTDVKHLTKDGTQTIHYQGAGDNTPKDNVQKTTFNHEEVIDKVTGKVVADHGWSPDSHTFGTVTTPVVNGYHADRTTAGGATVTPDNPDATIVVSYSPNGKIIPVDPNGNPIPNAPQPQYPTSPDNPTTVTPDEPVPTIPGYTPEHNTVTPTDPGKDTPVIYNPVTPKEVQGKQTVTFVDQDGNQLHDPSVTDHTFTKPGESFTYGNVTVPVIPGYVASKTTAGGKTGTYENPNVTDQIVYTKIGKIVPVDNNGNPIPGASQPIYNNDPKDPTKVVPNEAVPTVPGYNVDKNQNTPGFNKNTETVTPVDPTKDTKVVYNKPAQPSEPDNPEGPTTPQQPTNAPSQPTSAPSQPTIAPVHPENPAQPTNAPQPSNVPPHAEPNPTEPSPAPEPAPIAPKAQNNPVVPKANTVQPKSQNYVPAQNAATPAPTQTASGNTETALPQTGENEDNSIAAALAGGAAISISLIGLAGVRKRRRD